MRFLSRPTLGIRRPSACLDWAGFGQELEAERACKRGNFHEPYGHNVAKLVDLTGSRANQRVAGRVMAKIVIAKRCRRKRFDC